ncbi:transposase IS116/IS110/IS902 family protein (plasmid) [Pseudonocardia dioxanivorans CB1190]|uniref:Transposase IS116/IS110/IS902 family protein n=1 Tax=Pseudonocardia dioxanivorans (strain ATCC 55486 / DSM 44775 / JCM 13855 / CB1190) TaxID=675635 RepID=F2L775_PSEUX|nr:IS110 family transposase [Pseudonocardia dioxanivorans]AEA29048.1 transposase IS116/IS110/IS902 family protein [Pseudonocardia dioxanivorans CB1190]
MSEPDNTGFEVFCGLDVGKSVHHACALDRNGKRLHGKPLPNDEAALTEVFIHLAAHGRVLVVVDQPASIGALAVAVARSLNIEVAYLPGLVMRRIADLHPGQGKTDARDAHVIAAQIRGAARTMPHTLRRVGTDDETLAELTVLAGYDDDLAAQSTRLTNRLRDALLHVHPALERLLGPRMDRGGVLDLLAAAPTPQALRDLGEAGIAATMRARSPRLAKTLPAQILAALDTQTVVVPGTVAFGRVIGGVAAQLREVRLERDTLATELETLLEAHPLAGVLTSMPGLGFRTALKILTIVGDGAAFPTAGHLAAYAGLAPVTRRSGTSIKGETRSQRGNHALKSALFLSAFASLADPTSRAYYDRKRAAGKRHNAALICLARRRTDVIYAMLRDRRPYAPPSVPTLPPVAAAA